MHFKYWRELTIGRGKCKNKQTQLKIVEEIWRAIPQAVKIEQIFVIILHSSSLINSYAIVQWLIDIKKTYSMAIIFAIVQW